MDDEHKAMREAYIAELRALRPQLFEWWMALTGIADINDTPAAHFEEVWPLRISGHPRLIDVFRRYYMAVEDRNDALVREAMDRESGTDQLSGWMDQPEQPGIPVVNPIEFLVDSLDTLAPDVAKLAAGIVFVPVGLDQYDERV